MPKSAKGPNFFFLGIALLLGIFIAAAQQENLSEEDAEEIAAEAYVYAYPLVTMDFTKRVMTNSVISKDYHAPMGQFFNAAAYPSAEFKDVTTPNADTLYSSAWLDLAKEPYVLHVPDENSRYYLMPMLSGWTDVIASPGTRTTGTKAGDFAITGPNWKGSLPEGVKEIKSPTNMLWILGRTYSSGTPEDYKAVHEIQKQYTLKPLSYFGKDYTPPKGVLDPNIDMKTPVKNQVNSMSGEAFFKKFAQLLKDNPPAAEDADLVEKMKRIGIVPGEDFEITKLDPKIANIVNNAPKEGLEKIKAHEKSAGRIVNGWLYSLKTGNYDTDYLQRAFVALFGLGANLPEDAVYPSATVDSEGKPLNGANKYVIHFEKGKTPLVKGFWSLTMYDDQNFFVPNALNRYALSPRDPLLYNEDGSIDLYIQNESPGKDKETNWLPAPKDNFVLVLRMYWPENAVLNGSWQPPAVKKVSQN